MNDSNKVDLREAGAWLSGEIEIRVPKAWLAIAGVAIAVLLIVALD
ncbi:hypothetical protein [Litoreibacter roseus]|uniref:Uncharacterized protein n=1 Tax=Litoreibacter roseus TaxID=2601869 RepID=A0A6N6JLY2_9RHOB|nr:hypothetical protein [Litoreibacter roseus]GFE67316.1 hypothetical protein KIN_43900 [Litoreibacter roseus]